jgi:uncharacterized protein
MSQAAATPGPEGALPAEGERLKPVMPYLSFAEDGRPYLAGSRCQSCGQVFLGRRETCARCAARGRMEAVELATRGRLYNYTIVYRSLPGVATPFISAIVDLDGGGVVKGNLLEVEPTPEKIRFGMAVDMVFRGAETAVASGAGYLSHFFVPAREEQAR